jgi:hypothetical protein
MIWDDSLKDYLGKTTVRNRKLMYRNRKGPSYKKALFLIINE